MSKHRYNNILASGVTAVVLGLGAISTAAYAQDSEATPPSGMHDADADLANQVKQALHSDNTLDTRHIKVAVEHGDVVLHGFVQSSRALLAAGQVAEKAAGSHKVVNRLSIKQAYPNGP